MHPFLKAAGCSPWAGPLQPRNPLAESKWTAADRTPAQWELRRSPYRDHFDPESGAGTKAMSHPYSSRRLRRRSWGYTREEASLVDGDTGWSTTILVVWKKPCALNSESKKMFLAMNTGAGQSTSLSSRFPCEQRQGRRSTPSSADSGGPDSEVCVTHWTGSYSIWFCSSIKSCTFLCLHGTWESLRVPLICASVCLLLFSLLPSWPLQPAPGPGDWLLLSPSCPFPVITLGGRTDCR